jgi:hypothetical protein
MSNLIEEQIAPIPNNGPDCWLLVMKDMEERRQHGIAKYGVPVQPGNGRDPRIDRYQELLDACVYARQDIEEARIREEKWIDLLARHKEHIAELNRDCEGLRSERKVIMAELDKLKEEQAERERIQDELLRAVNGETGRGEIGARIVE